MPDAEVRQPTPPTDAALMASIVLQDEGALATLYDRYSSLVLAICVRVLHNRDDAEDVMVDIFWEVWQRADRFDLNRGSALTYLTTLSRSRAIDRRRSLLSRGTDRTRSLNPSFDAPVSTDAPWPAIVSAENRQQIAEALRALDENQRQAIECAYFDGLSHTEIASHLNRPLGTIKTNIRTGLQRMKSVLRRPQAEGEMKS